MQQPPRNIHFAHPQSNDNPRASTPSLQPHRASSDASHNGRKGIARNGTPLMSKLRRSWCHCGDPCYSPKIAETLIEADNLPRHERKTRCSLMYASLSTSGRTNACSTVSQNVRFRSSLHDKATTRRTDTGGKCLEVVDPLNLAFTTSFSFPFPYYPTCVCSPSVHPPIVHYTTLLGPPSGQRRCNDRLQALIFDSLSLSPYSGILRSIVQAVAYGVGSGSASG